MYIEFKSNKLRRRCELHNEGVQAWGEQLARKVVQRLNELKTIPEIQSLRNLPHLRCHPLQGSRAGQYAIDLDKSWRLVFELLDGEKAIESDTSSQTIEKGVRILEIKDYHGKTR